ncbi:FprA family A-type flavoprotein [Candidatus Aerophobetes bacterium]|nr:FprA family A-type flavoprotein [Candidatus Aerophobetes bacterium]
MIVRELTKDVFWVGAVDWDRRLFDELIPLPDGTSYNAYLVKGKDRTALIDTVDPTMEDVLVGKLKKREIKKVDYVISNHAEQDHSGTIPRLLELYPGAKVVTNPKCKAMLVDLLLIPDDKFITVDDGETLSLGNKTLEFIYAPWVHWPETMLTYLREDKILFSCDLFGAHLATSSLFAKDKVKVYPAAKRYYAEIMMPFRKVIQKNLAKIKNLDVEIVAPSHGPIHNEPKFIFDAYRDWSSDNVKNEAVITYVSMHGSTRKMVDYFVDSLTAKGITPLPFNLTKTDIGKLAIALVDAATIVICSPTVLAGPHPQIVASAYLINALRPKLKFVSIIGSYSWGGKMVDVVKAMLTNLIIDFIEPVIAKGYPKEQDFEALDRLVDNIIAKHKGCNIM